MEPSTVRGRNVVVVGTQWGDEGKGKVVDYLASQAQVVARYAGGNNAGHTLVIGGQKLVTHLVPSGCLYPGTQCVLGAGMVIDPIVLAARIILDLQTIVSRETNPIEPCVVTVGSILALGGTVSTMLNSTPVGPYASGWAGHTNRGSSGFAGSNTIREGIR